MKTVEFTSEELDLLRDLLKHVISDVDKEVLHTDTRDFKELLKHRREVLGRILDRVISVPVSA